MSRVYRFHGPSHSPETTERVLLRKRKKRVAISVQLIAADEFNITDNNGTRPIETYQPVKGRQPITLTRRESDLIALSNPGIAPPAALEDLHSWLPAPHYLNDSVASFNAIQSYFGQFNYHFVSATSYCDEKWNTVCNALRQKSTLDARFYTAWHLPIQDVHVLEESRPGRDVVAIDFNSMYPACMQQLFPNPSGLKLVPINKELDETDVLAHGLYRCIIEGPVTDFIARYNPFRSFHSGRYCRSRLDEVIEIDLNEFELEFYRRHFRKIHIVEAVISDRSIKHPLAKEVCRSFSKRKNYKKQANKALANREKFLSTLMASCTNRPARPLQKFEKRGQAMEMLSADYGITLLGDEPDDATDMWLQGRRGIRVIEKKGVTHVQGPNLRDGSACHLLSQRIVARGRILLLEMMERIANSAPEIEICYTNIDSIHFSLPTEHLESVLAWLNSECTDAMGSFKIEAITKHGLWLEPGRYWLYSNDVTKFRNRCADNLQLPFKDYAIYVANRKLGKLHVPIKVVLRMNRTMSPLRSLVVDPGKGILRQRLIEVGNTTTFEEVLNELEKNYHHSIPIRMTALAKLREVMNSS